MAYSGANSHSIAAALHFDGYVCHFCGLLTRAEANARRLVSHCEQHGFRLWLGCGYIRLGWARTLLGSSNEGLALMADGIKMYREINAELVVPYWLAMSAEAHAAAGRTSECIPLLDAACDSADRRGELWWKADLLRLKGRYSIEHRQGQLGEHFLQEALSLARQQASLPLQLPVYEKINHEFAEIGQRYIVEFVARLISVPRLTWPGHWITPLAD
jgi:predicted ATPase